MFGLAILIGFFLIFGISEARHIPVNGQGGSSSRFRPRLLVIRPPPGSNQPNRLVILTNPRLLSSNIGSNQTFARGTLESQNRISTGSTARSNNLNRPQSVLSSEPSGRTRSLRNLVNMLRQNQRRQEFGPTSNIARISNTVPRAAPPLTPKSSRFGDLNMPSVIEAALQRLREQSRLHGVHSAQRRPLPMSTVSIPRARSPFNVLGGPGAAQTSVSQSSSSSSSSSTSNQSSSQTVVQSSGLNSLGTNSQVVSSSKSSSSNSSQSFSSSSNSASISSAHPNFRSNGLNNVVGIANNVQPVIANVQPELTDLQPALAVLPAGISSIQPVISNVQPLGNSVGVIGTNQLNMQPPLQSAVTGQQLNAQAALPNIVPSPVVVQPQSQINMNNDMLIQNTNSASSSSSKTSANTSSTIITSDNVSIQSSAASSKSAAETKKTVSTKTVNVTTVAKKNVVSAGDSLSGLSPKMPPPAGSITVQRGPAGMSTITLADGQGDPVVLRAAGPVKIQRIITASGKVQFLINPIRPSALGEMEQEFEAEEIPTPETTTVQTTPSTTTQRVLKPTKKRKQAKMELVPSDPIIPTSTSFPLPWTTTRRPPPPRPPPSNLLAPPQMPVFEHVLNQISEIANSISNRASNTGSMQNISNLVTELNSNSGNTKSNNGILNSNNIHSNTLNTDNFVPTESGIISSQFIPDSTGRSLSLPSSQTVLNPVQGSIPISRTSVQSVTGDAGPVLSPPQFVNTAMRGPTNSGPLRTASSPLGHHTHTHTHAGSAHEHQHVHEIPPQPRNNKPTKSETISAINTVVAGPSNEPQPPYELRGHSHNSLPS